MIWYIAALAGITYLLYRSQSVHKPRLVIIGDSQAVGASGIVYPCGSIPNDPNCAKFGTRLATASYVQGYPAYVDAKVGARIAEYNARIDQIPIASGDVVIVFLGSNDFDGEVDPRPIVSSVSNRNARLIWVGPPDIRGNQGRIQSFLADVLGNLYFDTRPLELQLTDGVHPSPSEYRRWLQAILQRV